MIVLLPSPLLRNLAAVLVVICAASGCVAGAPTDGPSDDAALAADHGPLGCPAGPDLGLCERSAAAARSGTAARAVKFAMSQVGTPYCAGCTNRFGYGTQPSYDCSGLVWRSYVEASIDVGAQTSGALATGGGVRRVLSLSDARPGDVLGAPGHVALLLADGRVIEAPRPGLAVRIANVAGHGFKRAVSIDAR